MTHPKVTDAMRHGTFVDTIADARKWSAAGVRYVCYSVDVGLFTEKCREVVAALTTP